MSAFLFDLFKQWLSNNWVRVLIFSFVVFVTVALGAEKLRADELDEPVYTIERIDSNPFSEEPAYRIEQLNPKYKQDKIEPFVDLGKTVLYSDATIGSFGLRINDKWDLNFGYIGEGETSRGYHETSKFVSFSRIINPNWHFYGWSLHPGIGFGFTPDVPLIGDVNYRLRLIVRYYNLFEVEFGHYSSAGIWQPNTGLDFILFRLLIG